MEVALSIFCPHCNERITLKTWTTLETCPSCGIPIYSRDFKVLRHYMSRGEFTQEMLDVLEVPQEKIIKEEDHMVLLPVSCWDASVTWGNNNFIYIYPEVFTHKSEEIYNGISKLFGERASYVLDKMDLLFKSNARELDNSTVWMKVTPNFMPEEDFPSALVPHIYENVFGEQQPNNIHEIARGACCATLSSQEQEQAINSKVHATWTPTIIIWRVGKIEYEEPSGKTRSITYMKHYSACAKYFEIFDESGNSVYLEHIPADYQKQLHDRTRLRNPISTSSIYTAVKFLPGLIIVPSLFILSALILGKLDEDQDIIAYEKDHTLILYSLTLVFNTLILPFLVLKPYLRLIKQYVLKDEKCSPKEDIAQLKEEWENEYNRMQNSDIPINKMDEYLKNDFLKSQPIWKEKMRIEKARRFAFVRRYLQGMLACFPKYACRYLIPILGITYVLEWVFAYLKI